MARRQPSKWLPFVRIAPVIVLLIGLLLPVEVRINFAGQTIYAYRMAEMLVAPWIVYQMLGGRFQFRINDAFVVAAAVWMVLAFVMVDGFAAGLPSGFALALDLLIPYLAVRQTIRTFDDFRYLLIVLAPIALGLAILMAVEAVTHFRVIRFAAQAVFGQLGVAEYGGEFNQGSQWDTRFGLLRATGPFSHPILAGVFFACLLPLYYFSRLRGWPLYAGVTAGLAAVFSLSSAAFLGILMFAGFALFDRLRRMVVFLSWPIFIAVSVVALTAIHFVSQNGIISVLIRYTLNPQTGYYRLLIWEYGSRSVQNYPWFGIGHREFKGLPWMTGSVDSVWLAFAIRHGLAVSLLIGLAVVLAFAGTALTASRIRTTDASVAMGLSIALVMFFVLGFTVSFFGGLLIWFVMVLGIGTTFGPLSTPRPKRFPLRRRVRPA